MNDFKNTIGFIPYVFSTITCVLILFLPKNKRNCIINLGMCLLTAVLYLYSAYLAWNGKYYWKFDFVLGSMWLVSTILQTCLVLMSFLKPELYSLEKTHKKYKPKVFNENRNSIFKNK